MLNLNSENLLSHVRNINMNLVLNNMSKNILLHVTVLPPTRSRILPKLGTLSPIKSKMPTVRVRNAHRFQVNSEKDFFFKNFLHH